jgi:cephalosporin hydroxylase
MRITKTLLNNIKRTFRLVTDDEKFKLSLKGINEGHHKVTYKGIKAIRCPFDYVIYQMIIGEVRPDLIIEIGSHEGGGAMYLSDLMKAYDIDGEIHTIDIHDNAKKNIANYSNIKFFGSGADNYDLSLAKQFHKILVIEDAAHTYECSKNAIDKFAAIVSVGSYLIIEDGIVNELGIEKDYGGGPLKAIREFLPTHPEFIVDRKWCDMFGRNATFNVNGYLKKTK